MGPKELNDRLKHLEQLAKRKARVILQQERANLRGFLGEFSKLRAHLKATRSLEATRTLARSLTRDKTLVRSRQTRAYYQEAASLLDEVSREDQDPDRVLWSLGWLSRLFYIEDRVQGPRGRGGGGPPRGGNRGGPRGGARGRGRR